MTIFSAPRSQFYALFLFTMLNSIHLQPLHANGSHSQSNPMLLPLSHSISYYQNPNFTVLHHLKSSSMRSAARHRHRRHLPERRTQQVSLPLSPGSDYTLSISVGAKSSPTTVSLYMDTGSDLVWMPCSPFECILCDGKPSYPFSSPPPLPPADSHLIRCASAACSAVHSSLASSDLCTIAACPLVDIETSSCSAPCPQFYYAYGDGSLVGRLRRGPVSLAAASAGGWLRLHNFTFACAHSALGEPVGVAGFGRGPLSLPAQLAVLSPALAARFSYCFISHSFNAERLIRPSPLIFGRADSGSSTDADPSYPPFVYTPLLHNPKHPYFYSVALESISVGLTRITARSELMSVDQNGNGGMVVDSGTTFTMLPTETYTELSNEIDRQMNQAGFKRAVQAEEQTGLKPCYYYEDRALSRRVPGLALRFAGNATVALPRRNYFIGFESGGKRVGCLTVMDGGDGAGEDSYGGPAGTLGNFQQQGFEVVYDLDGERVGFARRRCAALWEETSRV